MSTESLLYNSERMRAQAAENMLEEEPGLKQVKSLDSVSKVSHYSCSFLSPALPISVK